MADTYSNPNVNGGFTQVGPYSQYPVDTKGGPVTNNPSFPTPVFNFGGSNEEAPKYLLVTDGNGQSPYGMPYEAPPVPTYKKESSSNVNNYLTDEQKELYAKG